MIEQHHPDPQRGPAGDSFSADAAQSRSSESAAEIQALTRLNDASSRLWHVSGL